MPAAAVIPAPLAYIKVVAVKKLVVGILLGSVSPRFAGALDAILACSLPPGGCLTAAPDWREVYFEETRVFTASVALRTLAWNDGIERQYYSVGS